jgi:hypothetical protein
MKKLLSTTALGALGVMTLAAPALAAHEGTAYSGTLTELNNSGATGSAYIEVSEDGETMSVSVDAADLDLDFVHAMHIHGIYDGDLSDDPADGSFAASTCPDFSDDANGDGVLTVVEGAGKYGGVLVSLTTEGDTSADSALAIDRFPAGTSIDYDRDITIPSAMKDELARVHVVVHGTDTDDSGDETSPIVSSLNPDLPVDATAPALCGTLTAVSAGAVQTGAGGAATTSTNPAALALGAGALAIAGAAALRRRGEQA